MRMQMEKIAGERRGGRPNRRAKIVATAERLLRERGLGGVTTRAIAEAVPCSEGAIYVHFNDRLDLIMAVLEQSLPEMLVPLHGLKERVGKATPEENLSAAMEGLIRFHRRVMVMLCSVVGEPELRERFQESLNGRGPEQGIATLATYIEEEQKLGRVATSVNAKTAARALLASSLFDVFAGALLGTAGRLDVEKVVVMSIGK